MNEPCQGKNCGTTTAQHSAECQQETEEHFAMIEVLRAFEVWLKSDFPEADLSRLPSFAYRAQSVRDMWRAWQAAYSKGDADGYERGVANDPLA